MSSAQMAISNATNRKSYVRNQRINALRSAVVLRRIWRPDRLPRLTLKVVTLDFLGWQPEQALQASRASKGRLSNRLR
jgi:hypothetical protein